MTERKREREERGTASANDAQRAQIKAWGTKEEKYMDEKRKQIEKQIQWTFDDGIKNWKANRYRKKREKKNQINGPLKSWRWNQTLLFIIEYEQCIGQICSKFECHVYRIRYIIVIYFLIILLFCYGIFIFKLFHLLERREQKENTHLLYHMLYDVFEYIFEIYHWNWMEFLRQVATVIWMYH